MLNIYKSKYNNVSGKYQGNKAFYGGFLSGFSIIKISQKTTRWHIVRFLCRLVRSLSCLVKSFHYAITEFSLFKSKSIYFADSLKITVKPQIRFPANSWTEIHTFSDHIAISLNLRKYFPNNPEKNTLLNLNFFLIYWLYRYNKTVKRYHWDNPHE